MTKKLKKKSNTKKKIKTNKKKSSYKKLETNQELIIKTKKEWINKALLKKSDYEKK
jgi:hypothetical protein